VKVVRNFLEKKTNSETGVRGNINPSIIIVEITGKGSTPEACQVLKQVLRIKAVKVEVEEAEDQQEVI
jgi:hypothetical protein